MGRQIHSSVYPIRDRLNDHPLNAFLSECDEEETRREITQSDSANEVSERANALCLVETLEY